MIEPDSVREARAKSLAHVRAALAPWDDAPDGIIFSRNGIAVEKRRRQVRLFFGEAIPNRHGLDLGGIMSRIDLDSPLTLLGTYAQAMMLSLAWAPEPQRIYVLGLGGGRLSMLMHHYFPGAVVDSTEIDADVIEVATRYFGLHPDVRQRVHIEDGRGFLERIDARYDIVLLDGFCGEGNHAAALSDPGFYRLCLNRVTEGGVVATNLMGSDPELSAKVRTFAEAFPHAWRFEGDGSNVLFGSRQRLSRDDLKVRAGEVSARCRFEFPFLERLPGFEPLEPFSAA